jgi:hypothetical protein
MSSSMVAQLTRAATSDQHPDGAARLHEVTLVPLAVALDLPAEVPRVADNPSAASHLGYSLQAGAALVEAAPWLALPVGLTQGALKVRATLPG